MSTDGHARVREVFLQAVELDPNQRAAFVREVCGTDSRLRHEVETLLDHHASETIIARSSTRTAMQFQDSQPHPTRPRLEATRQLTGRFLAGLFRSRNRRVLGILAALVFLTLLGA